MNDSKHQFYVGLFVIVALMMGAGLIVQFGSFRHGWDETYAIAVHFENAPGIRKGVPARMNGVTIGRIREVRFDQDRGGVLAILDVQQKYALRLDTAASIKRSLLGDSAVEFTAGTSRDALPPGSLLEGQEAFDPMQLVEAYDKRLQHTLTTFTQTTQEWRRVAANINNLLDTNEGNIGDVLAKTSRSLDLFAKTMESANESMSSANKILSDPEYQENLRKSLESVPVLVDETRATVAAVRQAVTTMDASLANLKEATDPLAKNSAVMVAKLDRSMTSFESLLADLNRFSKLLADEDGSMQKMASDPELYQNLSKSAGSMATLLRNLEPMLRDLRIFSDKIARHPELLGVGGMIKGSSGLKEAPEQTAEEVQPRRGLFRQ